MNDKKNETWNTLGKIVMCFIGAAILIDFYYPFGPLVGAFAGWHLGKMFTEDNTKSETKNKNRFFSNKSNQYGYLKPGAVVRTHVVGVSFDNRQETINDLIEGENVVLIRRPKNPYDENAIEVCVFVEEVLRSWKAFEFEGHLAQTGWTWFKSETESVGYINSELAAKIAPYFDSYSGVILPDLGEIIKISRRPNKPTGLEIKLRVPDELNRELAKTLTEVCAHYLYPRF